MKKLPEVKPTETEAEYIKSHYGNMKAQDMADALGISINRVYNICRKLELTRSDVRILFTHKQHQVIIAGILGDGNIKRNGSNYYYRETHSKKERGYCEWKSEILSSMLSKAGFHLTDKCDGQFGFQTINSPSFRWYKKLTTTEVIDELDSFGACIYLLDDGWAKSPGYCLSTGTMDHDAEEYLCDRLNCVLGTSATVIGHNTISFKKDSMKALTKAMIRNIPSNLDVFERKIQPLVDKLKG